MSQYNVLDLLENGTYGKVYKCKKENGKKLYACKIFNQDRISFFQCELNSMKKMNHKNIIRLKTHAKVGDTYVLIMELCDMDLFQFLEDQKLDVNLIGNFSNNICEGISFINNELKYIHRDIKLENILVKNGVLKLCDFNFTIPYNTKNKKIYKRDYGTLDYLCPEVIFEKEIYGPEIDIWGFGVILYIFITNEFPYNLFNKKGKIEKEDFIKKKLYSKYDKVLDYCFSKDRKNIEDVIIISKKI